MSSSCLLLFTLFLVSFQSCVHNQYYWLGQASFSWPALDNDVSPASLSMCGSQWYDLMQRNASQVTDSNLQYWLMSFHQVCTATLNLAVDAIVSKQVAIATALVRDSMERSCDNLVDWTIRALADNQTQSALQTLIGYNSESTCEKDLTSSLFSFSTAPELFVVDYNATALEMRELGQRVVKMTSILTTYTVVMSLLFAMLVVIMYLVYKSKKREYLLYNPNGSNEGGEQSAAAYKNEKQPTDDDFIVIDDDSFSINGRQKITLNEENPKTK